MGPPDATNVNELLDDYVMHSRRREHGSLAATALRTRSAAAREVLARAAGMRDVAEAIMQASGEAPTSAWESGPSDAANLARVVALQNLRPTDPADGFALFERAIDRFGPDRIPPARQALHTQLAVYLGAPERAAELCTAYRRIPARTRHILLTDLANPFTGHSGGDGWLERFQEFFPVPFPALATGDEGAPFDRLTTAPPATSGGEKVTVIVTSYLPDDSLLTTLRSLCGQSWRDLEVLLVDDASPPEYDRILEQCLELDERVRLLRMDRNGGTYRARNAGLDAASGDYVTFEDSDDWCHPARIEHQLTPLLEDPELVATVSEELAATDRLMITKPGRESVMVRPTSLMLRRKVVQDRVGYFDTVRKAADTELLHRIRAAFGPGAVHHLADRAYTVHRQRADSLSAGEFGGGWVHPARAAYWSCYTDWHGQIRAGRADPYLPQGPEHRPFRATASLGAQPQAARAYDVIYVTDWRILGEPQRAALDEIRTLAGRGIRVGVVHLETYRQMTRRRRRRCRPVQELINAGTVDELVLTDHAETALVVVRQPSVLQFPPPLASGLRARAAIVVADEAPSAWDGSDRRYAPSTCATAIAQLFSVDPVWCPQDRSVRELLCRSVPASEILATDMPLVVDVDRYRTPRGRPRSVQPVLGRAFGPDRTDWDDCATVAAAYPARPDLDIRLLGERVTLVGALAGDVPANWLVYEPDETDFRSFLYQIDFYVDFPGRLRTEWGTRSVVEALAAGCVPVLPERLAGAFGDAAVYCAAGEVPEVVGSYHRDLEGFLVQSRKATSRAPDFIAVDHYLQLVSFWSGAPACGTVPAEEKRGRG